MRNEIRDKRREGRGVGFMQKRVGGKEEKREEKREKGEGGGDPSEKCYQNFNNILLSCSIHPFNKCKSLHYVNSAKS